MHVQRTKRCMSLEEYSSVLVGSLGQGLGYWCVYDQEPLSLVVSRFLLLECHHVFIMGRLITVLAVHRLSF